MLGLGRRDRDTTLPRELELRLRAGLGTTSWWSRICWSTFSDFRTVEGLWLSASIAIASAISTTVNSMIDTSPIRSPSRRSESPWMRLVESEMSIRERSQLFPASVTVRTCASWLRSNLWISEPSSGGDEPGDPLLAEERVRLALERTRVLDLRLSASGAEANEESSSLAFPSGGDPCTPHAAADCGERFGGHDERRLVRPAAEKVGHEHVRPSTSRFAASATAKDAIHGALGPTCGEQIGAVDDLEWVAQATHAPFAGSRRRVAVGMQLSRRGKHRRCPAPGPDSGPSSQAVASAWRASRP